MTTDYTYINEDLRFSVSPDMYPDSPREWDNLGIITCPKQGKYSLADKGHAFDLDAWNMWDDVEADIRDNKGGVLILPLSIYDHGGVSIYVGKSVDRWDGSRVGFIYVTQEALDREGITLDKAEEILRAEVKTYNQYLMGDVYNILIEARVKACTCGECWSWETIDSCGGFYGHEEAHAEAKSRAEYELMNA